MRYRSVIFRVASAITILGTALATALIAAPAQARPAAPASASRTAATAAATSPGAATSPAGLITGIVDGVGARPLTGVCVSATGPWGSTQAVTLSDGRYVLGGLRPGGYTLHYSACAARGYVDQWSGGASWPGGAKTVTLAPGQGRALAPVTLRTTLPTSAPALPPAIARTMSGAGTLTGLAGLAGLASTASPAGTAATASAGKGAIAGTVTGDGKPLQDICVSAYGPSHGFVVTSKAGRFRIGKLKPGRYIVIYFASTACGKNSGNWLAQEYKNVNGPILRAKPTRVRVTANHTTTGIDAALRLGGEISGTVRGQNGKVVPRVCVEADGKIGRLFFGIGTVSTKTGVYAMHSLYPGKYTISFLPRSCGSKGNYVAQWWRDSPSPKHATTITLTSGRIVRGVDAALKPGAILSGVVRAGGPHGALLSDICVYAQPIKVVGPYAFQGTRTGKNGSYRLTGLDTGKYQVNFNRNCGNGGNYLPVKHTVSVTVGQKRTGFNAYLPPGAIITGTVTGAHGAPVRGICVSAFGHSGGNGAVTATNGTYTINALPSGSYTVTFNGGCGNSGSYAPGYYRDQTNVGSANPVTVTAGHTTRGIGISMPLGGTITGLVTDASGQHVSQLCVQVEPPAQAQTGFPFFTTSFKDGVFTARNLIPGAYAVNFGCIFGPGTYASQWFKGQQGQGTSDYVSAPPGVVTSGVDAVMRSGGFITGVVTSTAHAGQSGICVQAIPHGSAFPSQYRFFDRDTGFSGAHGTYRIGPLPAGSYDVEFGCYSSKYATQWYRGTASRTSVTPVSVSNNSTTPDIDAVLTSGGSISGEVTAAGQPRSLTCVTATEAANDFSSLALTNRQGRYTLRHLASGSYKLTFEACIYTGRHRVLLGLAARPGLVTVTAPHALTGIDGQLVPAGSIGGTVLGGPGATPQSGACVIAVPVSPDAVSEYTQTGEHGTYQLTGLEPGTYNVYFGDELCGSGPGSYAPQWYKDKAAQATATKVIVRSGHATTGIGVTLGASSAISGTVTSPAHAPVTGECVTATPVSPAPEPLYGLVMHPVIAVTGATGGYKVAGLPPGKYTVEFSTGCGASGFASQWWRNSATAAGATVITVPANATAFGIDAALRH
jgi:hypothetical protein